MTRFPPKTTLKKDREKIDSGYSDLSGPCLVPSYSNCCNFITPVDDASKVAWVRFVKRKSKTTMKFKAIVAEMELQNPNTPAAF